MIVIAFQITDNLAVCLNPCADVQQRKYQSCILLAICVTVPGQNILKT